MATEPNQMGDVIKYPKLTEQQKQDIDHIKWWASTCKTAAKITPYLIFTSIPLLDPFTLRVVVGLSAGFSVVYGASVATQTFITNRSERIIQAIASANTLTV